MINYISKPFKWFFKLEAASGLVLLFAAVIALIILLDTFQIQLSSIFPNLELFLYNLYETVKDMSLFIKDLIK